ncbi:MAG: hypothetical protein WGN25_04805 [Candidatus Electrothrix sp. GW3-4]|uniref:hypothetical protein n=1 Tax=Candidatus Electrothrix sp. GW3-4 TaxID=3126740 RepID=UPI0030CC667F
MANEIKKEIYGMLSEKSIPRSANRKMIVLCKKGDSLSFLIASWYRGDEEMSNRKSRKKKEAFPERLSNPEFYAVLSAWNKKFYESIPYFYSYRPGGRVFVKSGRVFS